MILTTEEYNARGFQGGENEAECEKALTRAEKLIDILTGGKCGDKNLNDEQLENLKYAVGAQTEKILLCGGQPVSGRTVIGDFSYTDEGEKGESICPLAMTVLKLAGLYCSAVKSIR